EPEPETESFRPGSIEDIIASAERAAGEPEDTEPSTTEPEDDERIVPFVPVAEPEDHAASEAEEKHFIVSEA
ncbi:MAG TPA: signal recognition particle-docking protein FtsY, partial [Pelagibacterium sp.]|nr:signal recognition particle-docking protein FtsY [Pelagibacterium sp.]